MFDGSTQMFDGSTQMFDGSTQMFDGSTQMFDGSTQMFDGSTQMFDGSTQAAAQPQHYRSSQACSDKRVEWTMSGKTKELLNSVELTSFWMPFLTE
jgi:X-X-X-Leu-X-X-Gly heptad repeat protein